MKVSCISDLDKFRLSKTGRTFVKIDTKEYYIFEEQCSVCGEPYMKSLKRKKTSCCSLACSQTGFRNHEYNKSGILNPWYGKKHSKSALQRISEHNKGERNNAWKGGVIKNNLPLYDTYAHQLDFVDEVRPKLEHGIKLLEVRCKYCRTWFVPKRTDVRHRVMSLNSINNCKENNFYCSDNCKLKCPVFRRWERRFINRPPIYTDSDIKCWSKEVLKRANYKCEICGKTAEHAHHIEPKISNPMLALDPDNGIAVCKSCHHKYGHSSKECSYNNLSTLC